MSKEASARESEQEKLLLKRRAAAAAAAAAAVIKTKPEGTSGRQFCEKLASRLRQNNEDWRTRAESLEREVLTLKQELLLRGRRESEVQEVFSEDLFGPVKDTDLLTESEDDDDDATPDLLMDTSSNIYNLPDTSTATATATATACTTKATACTTKATACTSAAVVFRGAAVQEPLPHVQFLQALCGLQPFSCPRPDPLLLGSAPEGGPILEESITQLLSSIWATFRASATAGPSAPGGLSPGRGALLWACEVLVSALDHCSRLRPSPDFSRNLEQLMRGLSHTLLCEDRDQDQEQDQDQQSGLDLVLSLCRSPLLRRLLIGQILCHLNVVTEQLWLRLQSSDPDLGDFPLVQFLNSCRLMWILDQLLPIRASHSCDRPMGAAHGSNGPMGAAHGSNGPMGAAHGSNGPMGAARGSNGPMGVDLSSVRDVVDELRRRVFPLSQEFPLFSVGLWRVLGLVTDGYATLG